MLESNGASGEEFAQKDTNFNVAFGINSLNRFSMKDGVVDYDGYIELKVVTLSVGDGGGRLQRETLGLHTCTVEDFESNFNKPKSE